MITYNLNTPNIFSCFLARKIRTINLYFPALYFPVCTLFPAGIREGHPVFWMAPPRGGKKQSTDRKI